MRLFIDIIIRDNNGHYDFEQDRRRQRMRQEAKAKGGRYVEISTSPRQIRTKAVDNQLKRELGRWNNNNRNGKKDKLKIRFNAHGSKNSGNLIMKRNSVSPFECAEWLKKHGLHHKQNSRSKLVICLACCYAAKKMCKEFVSALRAQGVRGFTVTGSPYTVNLFTGQVHPTRPKTKMVLGCIPVKQTPRSPVWKKGDGSKVVFHG